MNLTFVPLLILLSLPVLLTGQSETALLDTITDRFRAEGLCGPETGQLDRVLDDAVREGRYDLAARTAYLAGECAFADGKRAAAGAYFLRAEVLAQRSDTTRLPFYYQILQGRAAVLGGYSDEGRATYRRMIAYVDRHARENPEARATAREAEGVLQFYDGHYYEAATLTEQAIDLGRGKLPRWVTGLQYNNLAYFQGLAYNFEEALAAQSAATVLSNTSYYRVESGLNEVYLLVDLREVSRAEELLDSLAAVMEDELPPDSEKWISYFSTAAYLYNTADDLEAFEQLLDEWRAYLDRFPDLYRGNGYEQTYLRYRASLLLRRREFALAEATLSRSAAIEQSDTGDPNGQLSRLLLMAKVYVGTRRFELAAKYYHAILSTYVVFGNPPEAIGGRFHSRQFLDVDLDFIRILKDRAACYGNWNARRPDGGYDSTAAATIALADTLLLSLRDLAEQPGFRRQLDEETAALRKIEVGMAAFANRRQPHPRHVLKALNAGDRIKYLRLTDARAADLLASDDARARLLLRVQRTNRYRMDSIGLDLAYGESSGAERLSAQRRMRQLGARRDSIRRLLRALAPGADDPGQRAPLDLATLRQSILQDKEVLLHYTEQDSLLYTVAVTGDTAVLVRTRLSGPLGPRVNRLIADLRATDPAAYEQLHTFYRELIEPLLPVIGDRNLVVVADGIMNYLPFAALVTDPNGGEARYLIEDRHIRYLFNARYGIGAPERPSGGYALVMTPFSDGGTDRWPRLPWSGRMSKTLAGYVGAHHTETITGAEATVEQFRALAPEALLLHVASHAVIDNERPRHSAVLFAPPGRLGNGELGRIRYRADLAVLSACNSGRGRLLSGSGVANFGNTLAEAGCENLVMNLWEIRDEAAYSLLDDFYAGLIDEVLTKPEALARAQRNYLRTHPMTAHPGYWAPLIYVGTATPLARLSVYPRGFWAWVGGFAAALTLFLLYRLVKRA